MLGAQGYATAWLGKWHLGGNARNHGFEAGQQDWELNTKQDAKDPKGVFTLTAEAIGFIEKNRDRPFFVALSHYSPHGPVRFDPALREDYQKFIDGKKPRQTNAGYAAMVEALDDSVGQMLDWLDKEKLAEKTLVIFYSDNGGELSYTSNLPLRAGKGSLYEGGVRVPMIARWPGRIPAKSVNDARVCSIDFFPTFAVLAGTRLARPVDGLDLSAVLCGDGRLERSALYWHYPHYHNARPCGAILNGDWKLIEWFETGETELFDLARDPFEEKNLAAQNPAKCAELLADLRAWRKDVGAQMMTPNPDHDPAKADQGEKKQRTN
jgi:arylsulfatase A-like enzyme